MDVLSNSGLACRPCIMMITGTDNVTDSECNANISRRSSTRSIKRKKFDDELVESSLVKSERVKLKQPSITVTECKTLGDLEPVDAATTVTAAAPPLPVSLPSQSSESKRKLSKSGGARGRRSKKSKVVSSAYSTSSHGLGRWKAQDDLALILAVQQTCDLSAVHLAVKFSCRFSLNDVKERWHALLYNPLVSKTALSCIRQLHPDIIASIQAKALFSKAEEKVLKTVISTSQPTVERFSELLDEHRLVFNSCRTAKSLFTHWQLLKQYHLLPDQTVQPMPKGDHVLNFSDAEDLVDDQQLLQVSNTRDQQLERELAVADRRQKREIRHLEAELPRWQVLVDSVTGISPPEFDNLTLAVIRGRLVRYLMRSRLITLGRATKYNHIDVDLSLEGPSWKISRRQGHIRLDAATGEFYIVNEGKRPIYVDGKPVLHADGAGTHSDCSGTRKEATGALLTNNSVIEMSCLRFIFLINQDLIAAIRAETLKTSATTAGVTAVGAGGDGSIK